MNRNQFIQDFETKFLKGEIPAFNVGDTVRVHIKIVEGQKERTQIFTGAVIAKKGFGLSETFSVYRNAYGSSMERVFLLHSPKISKIEVAQKGKVRRAKLYYLRGQSGKAAKIKEQITTKVSKKKTAEKKVEEASPVENAAKE